MAACGVPRVAGTASRHGTGRASARRHLRAGSTLATVPVGFQLRQRSTLLVANANWVEFEDAVVYRWIERQSRPNSAAKSRPKSCTDSGTAEESSCRAAIPPSDPEGWQPGDTLRFHPQHGPTEGNREHQDGIRDCAPSSRKPAPIARSTGSASRNGPNTTSCALLSSAGSSRALRLCRTRVRRTVLHRRQRFQLIVGLGLVSVGGARKVITALVGVAVFHAGTGIVGLLRNAVGRAA